MNWVKLDIAQERFFERYPGGFEHPDMIEIGKKHRIEKLTARAAGIFRPERFENTEVMAEDIIKTLTSSSMVSVFEKPKFRDAVRGLSARERARMCSCMYQILHGDMEKGFNAMVDFLLPVKLAKWTVISVCPYYFKPFDEVFIKPTTAKGVIEYFDIRGLEYKPRPSWEFYAAYRQIIMEMKKRTSPLLGPDNAAFTGFLMLSMQ